MDKGLQLVLTVDYMQALWLSETLEGTFSDKVDRKVSFKENYEC